MLLWFSLSVETNTRRCNLLPFFFFFLEGKFDAFDPLPPPPAEYMCEVWLSEQRLGMFGWKHLASPGIITYATHDTGCVLLKREREAMEGGFNLQEEAYRKLGGQ